MQRMRWQHAVEIAGSVPVQMHFRSLRLMLCREGEDKMVTCSKCKERPCHLTCLTPALPSLPAGYTFSKCIFAQGTLTGST